MKNIAKTLHSILIAASVWLRSTWILLFLACTGAASATGVFTINSDGTVTDATTGLIWLPCPSGQYLVGNSCTGTANLLDWTTAADNAPSGWRLPNIRELQSIVDRTRNPAIQSTVFPGDPFAHYWSDTRDATNPYLAWYVNFGTGYSNIGGFYDKNMVRYVRGMNNAAMDEVRQVSSYADLGDGTVRHLPTGLVWQRCALGQSWNGANCVGSATMVDWTTAMQVESNFAGRNDWRLPSAEELASMIDYSRIAPALNTAIFPDDPANYLWSSTMLAGRPMFAWYQHSADGRMSTSFVLSEGAVRFVRTFTAPTPSIPKNVRVTAGPGRAKVSFDLSDTNGGTPISSYTATCSSPGQTSKSASGSGSPLVVTGLKANVAYTCTVTASNGTYTSTASAGVTVTPAKAVDLTSILMLLLD